MSATVKIKSVRIEVDARVIDFECARLRGKGDNSSFDTLRIIAGISRQAKPRDGKETANTAGLKTGGARPAWLTLLIIAMDSGSNKSAVTTEKSRHTLLLKSNSKSKHAAFNSEKNGFKQAIDLDGRIKLRLARPTTNGDKLAHVAPDAEDDGSD